MSHLHPGELATDDQCAMPDAMLGVLFAAGAVVGLLLTPVRGLARALWWARTDHDARVWLHLPR